MDNVRWLREYNPSADENLKARGDTSVLAGYLRQCADELEAARSKLDRLASGLGWFEHLRHGDAEHQRWLSDAISAYINGKPRPEPYGLGVAEGLRAQVKDLESRLDAARKWSNDNLLHHGELYDELAAILNNSVGRGQEKK